MLLALLFLSGWCWPELPSVPLSSAQGDIDRTIIRIHSRQKWPEAITITSLPTLTPEVADAAPPVRDFRKSPASLIRRNIARTNAT
jgi:hypothetical protein